MVAHVYNIRTFVTLPVIVKRTLLLSIGVGLLMTCGSALAQKVRKEFSLDSYDSAGYEYLAKRFGNNKDLLPTHREAALIALSYYPELADIKIRFKYRKKGAPFAARPRAWDTIFKGRKKRTYLILVRSVPTQHFSSFHVTKVPFNAMVGVFGHELAHISDFQERGLFGMMNVMFGNLSRKYLDEFEYNTDQRTIDHGLGFQLLEWNTQGFGDLQSRDVLPSHVEKMVRNERYMYPATIRSIMASMDMYQPYVRGLPGFSE